MTPRGRPTVVMVVINDVTRDTRVKKMAVTLAHAGCQVTVYGFSKESARWETTIGPVRIVRLGGPRETETLGRAPSSVWRLASYRSQAAAQRASDRREERRARVAARIRGWKGRIDDRQRVVDLRGHRSFLDRLVIASFWYRIKGLRSLAAVPEALRRLRLNATRGEAIGRKLGDAIRRRLRRGLRTGAGQEAEKPLAVVDRLEELFVEELRGRHVDAIHAHDFFTIGMASRAAEMLSQDGVPVRWVYDAHEYVRGLEVLTPERRAAALELEGQHIRSADRVMTVTPELAERLQDDYQLRTRPDVVMNAPALLEGWSPQETVRSRLGVPDDVPLLVYAGQVKPARDVHTLVSALEFLPEAHLALVTANRGSYVDELADIAAGKSASHRYHVMPYVASHEVSGFLSDASVGVVPLTHYGNAEVALPTKLFEFLHARLPMVVSDTAAMCRFVTELGVGEVFSAGDARSLAATVHKVLNQPDRYRQPLLSDPEILMRYSWQRQERVLIDAYSGVLNVSLSWDGETPTSLQEDAVPSGGATR